MNNDGCLNCSLPRYYWFFLARDGTPDQPRFVVHYILKYITKQNMYYMTDSIFEYRTDIL